MPLQALCTAIRSQLHFSQITAWSDLLKTCSPFDSDIKTNPRIKNTSIVSFKPKLDVLYRIRPYDSTSCFSSAPTEHNFPETMVTDQVSVQVSLLSLPRMKSIPRLHDFAKVPSNLGVDELNVQPMVVECNEKGKHRCTFDEESPSEEALLSHRDKQLQKYKKRLLRRDKKKRCGGSDDSMANDENAPTNRMDGAAAKETSAALKPYDQTINPNRPPLYSTSVADIASKPLTAAGAIVVASVSLNTNNSASKSTQTSAIEMVSVATQTEIDGTTITFPNCDFCGIEMQYFCWNCDKKMFNESSMDDLSSPSPTTLRLEKSDRLLKAIQRTPSTKQNKAIDVSSCCKRQKTVHNYFNRNPSSDSLNTKCGNNSAPKCYENTADDIRLTQLSRSNVLMMNEASASGGYRRTMSESVVGACHDNSNDGMHNLVHMGIDLTFGGESMNVLSDNELKLYRRAYSEDELICNCDDNRPKQLDLSSNSNSTSGYTKCPPNSELPLSALTIEQSNQFKTPTASPAPGPSDRPVNPIYIKCHNNDDERTSDATPTEVGVVKSLPKINLSKLFGADGDENDGVFGNNHNNSNNRDLDVDGELQKITQTSIPADFSLNNIFDFENLSPPLPSPTAGIHVVQKSNSVPTFFHSPPTLSPRFIKSAAASKRRSRHLSDRSSERLSIGSDDHLSDEEFHQYCADAQSEYRPGISPTKATLRFFPKNYAFRKRALLGKLSNVHIYLVR